MGKQKSQAGASTCWSSDLPISKDSKCPHTEEVPKVLVPWEIWQRIMALTKDISTEWLGYLRADKTEDGSWVIKELIVPKQEVGYATVTPKETVHSEGVVHSHVNMKAFFSGTDDSYLNENHHFSIVVNKSEEYAAVCRLTLPCKAMTVIETTVEIITPDCDVDAFLAEAKKNLEEVKYTPAPLSNNPGRTTPVWNTRNKWNPEWSADSGVPDYIPEAARRSHHFSVHDEPADLSPQERVEMQKLLDALNETDNLPKKKRKELIRKLNQMGVTLHKDKVYMATIELPDFSITDFPIDGKIETEEGTIIGRYCKNCQAFTNIHDLEMFAIFDKWTRLYECITCGSFETEPIIAEVHCKTASDKPPLIPKPTSEPS